MKITNYRIPVRWITVEDPALAERAYIVLAEGHEDARVKLHRHFLTHFRMVNPNATVEEYISIGMPYYCGDICNAATGESL